MNKKSVKTVFTALKIYVHEQIFTLLKPHKKAKTQPVRPSRLAFVVEGWRGFGGDLFDEVLRDAQTEATEGVATVPRAQSATHPHAHLAEDVTAAVTAGPAVGSRTGAVAAGQAGISLPRSESVTARLAQVQPHKSAGWRKRKETVRTHQQNAQTLCWRI